MNKSFNIEGLHCASCVNALEKAMHKLEGVQEASVNLATNKMEIKYKEDVISEQEIVEAVSKAGFKAITNENIREIVIPVQGMT
ncbi:Copper ion binding protein CopP [Tepidibacter aestuarii]|nr:Copper ion binding protein CopP [Tepidibacter aestuarii]